MFDDGSPIYRQIADRIRADVLSGALAGGRAGDVDHPVRELLPHQPGHGGQGVPAAGRRGRALQAARRRDVRQPGRPRRGCAPSTASRFFEDVVDPMVAEAVAIGVPIDEVIDHVRRRALAAASTDGPGRATTTSEVTGDDHDREPAT